MLKMKKGFFRVTPINKYVPLTGTRYYAYENDNVFSIYKDDTVVASYSAFSRGIGKALSVFNVEYVVYEDGNRNIYCVDDEGLQTRLLSSIDEERSMFCCHNLIYICTRNAGTLTIRKYKIVGIKSAPVIQQVDSDITITVAYSSTEGLNIMASVRTSETEFFVYQTQSQCVKLTISPTDWGSTVTHNVYNNTIQTYTNYPVRDNNERFFFVNKLDYYADITSASGSGTTHTIKIYNSSNTLLHTYTIATTSYGATSGTSVKVFFKPNGGGSAYAITSGTNSTPSMIVKLYDLTNGTATELRSYTSGQISAVSSSGRQNGFYLWTGRFCGYSFGTFGFSAYKANVTTGGISGANAINVNTAQAKYFSFGNSIKVADF